MSSVISVICGIATMRASEEANQVQVENFVEFQKCFFKQALLGKELVLVEQRAIGSTESAYDGLIDPRAKHVVVYNDRFTQAWLLNVGAVASTGNILAFIDADVIYGNDHLECGARALFKSGHSYLHGFDYSYWFNAEGRRRYLQDEGFKNEWPPAEPTTRVDEEIIERVVTPDIGGNIGLSTFILRDFYFNDIGGHNESFIWGGGRDNDIAFRTVAKAGIFPILQYPLLHLFHGAKIMIDGRHALWAFTQKHPELVTEEIKRMGVGDPAGPRNHTIEEWEELAKYDQGVTINNN